MDGEYHDGTGLKGDAKSDVTNWTEAHALGQVNVFGQDRERAEHVWSTRQDAVALAVQYAAKHAATESSKCGFLLYGGRAINSYIGL